MLLKHLLCFTATTLLIASPGAAATGGKTVAIDTNMGTITVELNSEAAPKTVANFLQYVETEHFNGTIFHRVIPEFMIQGGGFDESMQKKPTLKAIENESNNGLSNVRGTIAMARTGDPHSATAQFYINTADNVTLDYDPERTRGPRGSEHPERFKWGYAVFGKVIAGMEVVDKISALTTGSKNGMRNVPVETVTIEKVRLLGD